VESNVEKASLNIFQKRFEYFQLTVHWLEATQRRIAPWKNWIARTTGVGKGGKTGISPPLEIVTKNQNFLENLKSAALIQIN